MAEAFMLDPRLEAGSEPVTDWPLCHVRLKDDARFHWLLLVPERTGLVELTDLGDEDYRQLAAEIRAAVRLVQEVAQPDKTNVATLGNVVAQLHVHVVGRFRSDPAWPGPVWSAGRGSGWPAHAFGILLERYAEAAERLRPG